MSVVRVITVDEVKDAYLKFRADLYGEESAGLPVKKDVYQIRRPEIPVAA